MTFVVITLLAALVASCGFAGAGRWARPVAGLASMVWLVSLVVAFWNLRWYFGFVVLLLSFIAANIGERVFRRLLGTANLSPYEQMRRSQPGWKEQQSLIARLEEHEREHPERFTQDPPTST